MSKKQSPDQFGWDITKHVCRICLGRVMHRVTFEGINIYHCSNCEAETKSEHEKVQSLCCCGTRLSNQRDAGIRCVSNDMITPEQPAAIVAMQIIIENIPAK